MTGPEEPKKDARPLHANIPQGGDDGLPEERARTGARADAGDGTGNDGRFHGTARATEPPSKGVAAGSAGVSRERTNAAVFEDEPTITAPGRSHYTVLLVEDNAGDARVLREMLFEVGSARFHLTHVDRLSHAVQLLGQVRFDAVLLDLGLPDASGLEAVLPVSRAAPDVPIVVLSGMEDEQLAVQAVQLGAQDYLVKGLGTGKVGARSIRYAIER